MAANHRNLGETLRQLGQIHWSRFRWAVVAARQPRRAAHFEPGVDIDMHIQLCGEPQDRIIIGMTARYSPFPGARIFYSDAGTVADPPFDLGATFFRKTRVNQRTAGESVLIPLQNFQDFRVVWIRGKRLLQCAADLLSNGPLDAHAFDEKVVSLILFDGVFGCEAMEMVVPNPVGNQLVPCGEPVVGWVDEKLTWVHIFAPRLTNSTVS